MLLMILLWFCCTVNAQQTPDLIVITNILVTEPFCDDSSAGKIVVEVDTNYEGELVFEAERTNHIGQDTEEADHYTSADGTFVDCLPGCYKITVSLTDHPECSVSRSIVLSQLAATGSLTVSEADIVDSYCTNPASAGSVVVRVAESEKQLEWFAMFDAVTGVLVQLVTEGIGCDGMCCTFTDVAPGKYFFKAGNTANSCVLQSERNNPVEFVKPVVSSAKVEHVLCNSDYHTGEITALVTGGIPALTYILLNENKTVNPNITGVTSGVFSALPANTYHLVVKDAASCIDTVFNIIVRKHQSPNLTASEVGKIICWNEKGTITIHAVPYSLDGSSVNQITSYWIKGNCLNETDHTLFNTFNDLNGCTYTLYAQDSYGCIGDTTVVLDEPALQMGITLKDVIQPFANKKGSITVTVSGGWEDYTVVVTKIVGPSQQELLTLTNQPAGDITFDNLDAAEYRIAILNDQKGCTKASPLVYTLEMATNELEHETLEMKIFPNPSDGQFTIEWNNNEDCNVTLELYNMNGQLVYKTNAQTGAHTMLDISNYSRGVYLLHIPELNIRQKLVIK